jgi:hypothetical protein
MSQMPKYLFLDTWTLSDYTSVEYVQRLANFIKSNGYTIIFNGIAMTELYNPGWANGGIEERGARAVRFLNDQHLCWLHMISSKKNDSLSLQFPCQVTSDSHMNSR